ncbi:MAG: PspA/IM30 family protein [Planctomycetia bacterium]|nr:PspA/IM30 family protein [Planctomycetia bacterium]
MGVFKRLGTIVAANVNDAVDRCENPQKMLQQAVREMEQEISEGTALAANAVATEKLLTRRVGEQEREIATWQQRAETAVRVGDDKLARKALARKHDCESLTATLKDDLSAAQAASQTLRRQVEGMKSQYEDAKRQLAILVVRKRAADARSQCRQVGAADCTLDNSAFDNFERMKEKVELAEAHADALIELGHADFAAYAASERTSEEVAVEAELAALKAALLQ